LSLSRNPLRHKDDEEEWGKVTMGDSEWLAEQFETNRGHLRAVAYRMLGSLSEADDAVQEAWLRLSGSQIGDVENLRAWLTTVVARLCLDMLRSRKSRREESLEAPISQIRLNFADCLDPEQEAMMADSVGLALLVVLDTLPPAERLAFVLHDIFAMPFDEIAPIVGRSLVAAKKLASRARHRVQGGATAGSADLTRQRKVVEAFLAASKAGDMNALLAVLDPDVTRHADPCALPPGAETEIHGAPAVAKGTLAYSFLARFARVAIVNGTVGLIVVLRRRLAVALSLKITKDKITAIDVIADPERLRRAQLAVLAET
jgi:RNA polymerase sigma factor (sigma-70 family)